MGTKNTLWMPVMDVVLHVFLATVTETEDTALIQVTWNKAGPGNYTQELLEDILGKVN